jgi:hypothetical protein
MMNRPLRGPWVALLAIAALLCVLLGMPAGAASTFVNLTGADGVRSDAWDISDNGFVAGSWSDGAENMAARWEITGGTVTRTLIVASGIGFYVNSHGDVAGIYGDFTRHTGFLFRDGVRTDIEPFPGDAHIQVTGMNASGQVIGISSGGGSLRGFLHSGGVTNWFDAGVIPRGIADTGHVTGDRLNGPAFLFANGVFTDLPAGLDARGINSQDEIAGIISTADGTRGCFFRADTGILLIDPTPGFQSSVATISGTGHIINEQGAVFGVSFRGADNFDHPFIWTRSGGTLTLPLSAGAVGGDIYGSNDNGECVGHLDTFVGNKFVDSGFIYRGGTAEDLNTLVGLPAGVRVLEGRDLNTQRQVVVVARDANSNQHALVLTLDPAARPVTHFRLRAVAGASGSAPLDVTATALDADNQVVAGYRGTVHWTSNDPKAVLPANYTFTAADNGVHHFSVTLKTAGRNTITVTDTSSASITGSTTVDKSKPALKLPKTVPASPIASAAGPMTLQVQATDEVGVAGVHATVTGPGGFTAEQDLARTAGTDRAGTWEGGVSLPPNLGKTAQVYHVTFTARDGADNRATLPLNFTVAPDKTLPILSQPSATPADADPGQSVALSVRAQDLVPGVATVQAKVKGISASVTVTLTLRPGGSLADGVWEGVFTPPVSPLGSLQNFTVTFSAVDSAGNAAKPVSTTFRVVKETVAPSLTNLTVTPLVVANDDKVRKVAFSVRATDNIGVKSVQVVVTGTVAGKAVRLVANLTPNPKGTPAVGTWTGALVMPKNPGGPDLTLTTQLTATDVAGNRTVVAGPEISLKGRGV